MTRTIDARTHRQRGRGRKAFWVLLIVGVALILVAAARSPGRGHGGSCGGPERHRELSAKRIADLLSEDGRWFARAGIEHEQRRQLAVLLEESLPEIEALAEEREELLADLAEALESEVFDPARIDGLRSQATDLGSRALDQSFDLVLGLADVLTPEQRLELIRHWKERR